MNLKYNNMAEMFSIKLGHVIILSIIFSVSQAVAKTDITSPSGFSERKGVTFYDIIAQGFAGVEYRHTGGTARMDLMNAITSQSVLLKSDISSIPLGPRSAAGVALFDFDRDGDLDIYVTNGPGTDNALYANQLHDSGKTTFIDVARKAGVTASSSESVGVCYGDIDNDGDLDLYVLNSAEDNILLENQGDGTFTDITLLSGAGGGSHYRSSCSMGDINGDGLLDIAVANTAITWDNRIAFREEAFVYNDHNQLFLNTGLNKFDDVSVSSGLQTLTGFVPEAAGIGGAGITWAIAMVDYDLDGDADIVMADDQGPLPTAARGGADRGLIHLMQNDGTGHFKDVNVKAGVALVGAWMGLSFGDFNADGRMDIFGSNVGDYMGRDDRPGLSIGIVASRWLLGGVDGTFSDPGVGDLLATAFAWGTVTMDYDNDGDTDIAHGGGLHFGLIYEAPPSVILQNDGAANFTYDLAALASSTDHTRRNVKGMAQGDLNGDGFVDLVSVSSFDIEADLSLHQSQWGTDIDSLAFFLPIFTSISDTELAWTGNGAVDGSLSIELNSADNGNNWVAIDLLGTTGITSEGRVNRDGIGAVVSFTPKGGKTILKPVLGGASYASQDSLTAQFGLGTTHSGTIDVLWPGSVNNRLYNVHASEKITFPEIPCSYDSDLSQHDYIYCVKKSLRELHSKGVINNREKYRLLHSAVRAFKEARDSSLYTNNKKGDKQ